VIAAGVVRPARRPAGWVAPGPTPVELGRPELEPAAGEDLCWLAGNWRILQRQRGHRFSIDDVVTAHFAVSTFVAGAAPATEPARALDLGCGIGSVLLFVAWRFPGARCLGVEAQPLSASLARRSIARNGAEARCTVEVGDFRERRWPAAGFDLVTGTPPYFPRGAGVESDREQCAPCRFEHRGGIEDYCAAAARALSPSPAALLALCAPAGQAARVAQAAAASGLAIVRRQEIVPRAGKPPLFSVFALCRLAFARGRRHEAPLIVRDEAGRRTPAFVGLRAEMGMPP
jgi:tRNA1Val (adenine37-N6)-methyltransferase